MRTRRSPLTGLARNLRRQGSDAEARLWYHLRNRQLGGVKFRRQFPLGSYIADIVCMEVGVIVELDGGQHAETVAYDDRRTAFFETQGFRVLRFWNDEVLRETDAVLSAILEEVRRGSCPSP